MSYKTLMGALPVQSYDSSGINPDSGGINPASGNVIAPAPMSAGTPPPIDITNPADSSSSPDTSESQTDTSSGDKVVYTDQDTSTGTQSMISPLILLGIVAFAIFITKKKK